jgi:hypothetical protein
MIVRMILMVLEELYLPSFLWGDKKNIGDHKKRKRYWKTVRARKKIIAVSNMIVLWG